MVSNVNRLLSKYVLYASGVSKITFSISTSEEEKIDDFTSSVELGPKNKTNTKSTALQFTI